MADWRFIALLHNLQIEVPVDTEHMAVVPLDDPRLRELLSNSNFKHFVSNFRDQFKRKRRPSALIARGRVRRKPESVPAFRNALALSAVTRAWERGVAFNSVQELKYSAYFDFYPYLPTDDMTLLVVQSPGVLSIDEIHQFSGQGAPGLAPGSVTTTFYDETLLSALMQHWRQRHVIGNVAQPADESLFRSLEMAYRASRMPHDNRSSLDDYGAALALWVSAFEILAWPANHNASLDSVLQLLRPTAVSSRSVARRRYVLKMPRGKTARVSLIEKLYAEIYRARNAFLHGNPVTIHDLFPSKRRTRPSLFSLAPVLYRCALYSSLDLWSRPMDAVGAMSLSRALHAAATKQEDAEERTLRSGRRRSAPRAEQ